ncbi:ribonuclease H-like domain-containing protein [uncultured Peptoniphilus sp.]|uniref:ribonuclease H-like domain-containing protein n=1 Tax=uncultured Peptoniphilus sp. TaxID=254354 RepID=UPI002605A0ED|nr:ribonuclease H-like domain-containing protein [uncultured Peptoniphilus sp.]
MKKLERKIIKSRENYLKIETSGLSREIDSIIVVSLVEKNRDVLKTFYLENLKEEKNLLEEVMPILEGKEFVTYSGKTFDLPFIREKVKFYFNRDLDLKLIDLQEVTKKYNFIFNLDSHSNKNLLEKFIGLENLKEQKEYQGIKIKSLFKNYLEGDRSAIEKILAYNFMSLENLILLDAKIKENLEKNLSLKILDFTFFIRDIKLLDNKLEISGVTNYGSDYFSNNELYTIEISGLEEEEKICEQGKIKEEPKNFSLKINTEDGLYDDKNSCYYVKKKGLDFDLTNPSKIKSPPQIQILYYKNHKFKNQVELMRKIIVRELSK